MSYKNILKIGGKYNMFTNIQLYQEPLEIFDEIPEYKKYCEMSEFEQSFLCGMLKKVKPKKVVEIGTSAGGTTAVILNCLTMLGNSVEMYSCDISKEYYRDSSLTTGFIAEKVKKQYINNRGGAEVNHTLMTGDYAPNFLPKIGKGIDFLILDTCHSLPGEMLDFLACLPYLKPNACVVLHDVSMNVMINRNSYATKLLFDTVVADKYIMLTDDRPASFPNIAAFKITDDTHKYIRDCFSALTITWGYMPNAEELKLYHDFLLTEYDSGLVNVYDKAISLQMYIACKDFKDMGIYYDVLMNKWRKAKHVIIYGCGLWGKCFLHIAEEYNLPVDCFAISDGRQIPELEGITLPVVHLSELQFDKKECLILLTVEKSAERSVIYDLMERGYMDIY